MEPNAQESLLEEVVVKPVAPHHMTMQGPDQIICEECLKQTRIEYKYGDSFFTPRLRSINHLCVGRSNIISSPVTILLELLYRFFTNVKAAINRFLKKLFPRRDKTWGRHFDSKIVGRLTFCSKADLHTPIHNMCVEVWARTWWGQWRRLSKGLSDHDGYFTLPYDLRTARSWQIKKVQFEAYQTTYIYFKDGKPHSNYERFKFIRIPKGDLIGMQYTLRTVQLFLWEYRTDANVPRVVIKDHDTDAPQYYSQPRVDAMNEQVIPIELTKLKHLEQIKYDPDSISLAEIQADYPENLTVCIEKKLPGYTRGDHWFGQRMMNGMNRGAFLPDATDPGYYWIKYFGICHYDHNDEYALPTAEIKFRLKPDGLPTPVEIHLTGSLNAFNKDPWQKRVFTPESGDEWLYAKRIARVNGGFSTEVDEHFAGTHLNTEQYAIAAYRNLRLSPIACLLLPHLKEVVLINHAADNLLIRDYIPSATALTEKGLHQRTRDILGMQDWKSWQPMQVLSNAHTVARSEQMFWDVLVEYIERFFASNLELIKQHWFEVYRFSEELVAHSVPVLLSDVDLEKLSPEERALAEDRLTYYAFQYCFDPTLSRALVNGERKAVSPITTRPMFDESRPEELENLKQACRYIIMVATYLHTWINEHQYDDIGEVLYNCGGLRFGEKERGVLAPESDLSIAPDLTRSTQMLWIVNLLSRTEYGFITRNEEGDEPPLLRELLLAKEAEFKLLGVEVSNIESRTNI